MHFKYNPFMSLINLQSANLADSWLEIISVTGLKMQNN